MSTKAMIAFGFVASSATLSACSSHHQEKPPPTKSDTSANASASATPIGSSSDSAATPEVLDAGVDDAGSEPEKPLQASTKEEILALADLHDPPKGKLDLQAFLDKTFGPGTPYQSNQGNEALAKHGISRKKCLEGLSSITLQTEDQKRICGADNMVPIYKDGDITKAKTCIDVFEFPNKACELPFVWIGATQAKMVCEAEGKRLCRQEEWSLACGGDPEGGAKSKYAYGDALDLDVCNTNKSAVEFGPNCDPDTVQSAWDTCATNTEPSGSFPRCRSRFGVFDQHGNVAEIMTRLDVEDGHVYDQLKGSAFFYTDVARDENGNAPKGHPKIKPERMRTTYPDICAHDPRWHVEPIGRAWHVNYHLGFRCCKSL